MTDKAVQISITLTVEGHAYDFQEEIPLQAVEQTIKAMTQGISQQLFLGVIQAVDQRYARSVPKGWRNVGTEERQVVTSLGAIRYRRRIYLDEAGQRRKPVDELLGVQRYERMGGRVKETAAALASVGTYRQTAVQLSYLAHTPISPSTIQRMIWALGNHIANEEEAERQRIFTSGEQVAGGKITAPVLYGESDGVWLHLQREKRKSVEVRVGLMSTGRKPIGKDRFRLENKHWITAIGVNSEAWQEQILREAHLHYDLESTHLLVCGGDGNQWVRHSFDRLQIRQEFVLDRFHLQRAARRAFQDHKVARQAVEQLRQQGFQSVQPGLRVLIQQSQGKKREKLEDFYRYVHHNQDGLLDLKYRGISQPACLGAIEGNVDKLVVHRMKGRGCCWRLPGARAMLAICRHAQQLAGHAYEYLPVFSGHTNPPISSNLTVEYAEVLHASIPLFQGPDQNKPFAKRLHDYIYGR
ncbi:MAG TPA: UPF0236 family protein [Anaerolineaceae bacterium]|nr:UPF0236 family protein [Anaerolineaceae bacterium]